MVQSPAHRTEDFKLPDTGSHLHGATANVHKVVAPVAEEYVRRGILSVNLAATDWTIDPCCRDRPEADRGRQHVQDDFDSRA